MKISIVGAGHVGGTLAQRIVEADLADVVLLDIAEGIAQGKALDLSDARYIIGHNRKILGTCDYRYIEDSSIVVITAGLARKPGMSREDLLKKNSAIIKSVISEIVKRAPESIIIMVTNPLDILTNIALKVSQFSQKKVIGMGGVLDSSRFANLIAEKLNVSISSVEALVIGAHGQTMIPSTEHSKVFGRPLTEMLSPEQCEDLFKATVERGAKIVSCLGEGSAYYAPSAAVFLMLKAIVKNERKIVTACAYLNGEYGIKDTCIGVPIQLGRGGVEKIIELNLQEEEKKKLIASAKSVKEAAINLL